MIRDHQLRLIECMISGQHLKSCDDDGFCSVCGFMDNPKTAEEYMECFGGWIDDIAEANDNLGTCLGITFTKLNINPTPGTTESVDVVQLVFEHGIVDARRDTFELLSIRTLTRFDGS